jgi:hypothetical protein
LRASEYQFADSIARDISPERDHFFIAFSDGDHGNSSSQCGTAGRLCFRYEDGH